MAGAHDSPGSVLKARWDGFLVILIDLAFVVLYAAAIVGVAVALHLLGQALPFFGLPPSESTPFTWLATALFWIDCVSAVFASLGIMVESAIGRGKILKVALDELRSR
jgi:hypothetical protein